MNMAKKHIFTLLSLLSLFAYANAQDQVGEISDDSVLAESVYPLRYDSYQPEYAERMTKLDYETILEEIDEKRAKAKKRRKTLPELDPVEAECKRCLQMLKASDQVLILDSVVVDKHDLLSAYGFGKEWEPSRCQKIAKQQSSLQSAEICRTDLWLPRGIVRSVCDSSRRMLRTDAISKLASCKALIWMAM